jgi:hypothetical protein
MLKFSEFVYKINEAEENRGVDVLNQQQTTTTQTPPAPSTNAPATLFQLFNVFIQKYNQRSPISSGTTTATDDLTLRVSKFKINQNKKKRMIITSEAWLNKQKIALTAPWQIDIITIVIDLDTKKARLKHYKNAIEGII